MRKGISPIVAVVLLIAIAVIAAVGLYFWVGGLATKQPTPDAPIVLSGQRALCQPGTGLANLTVIVQNLDASGEVNASNLRIIDDDGAQVAPDTEGQIIASSQVAVQWLYETDNDNNITISAGHTYVILSTDAKVGQAVITC